MREGPEYWEPVSEFELLESLEYKLKKPKIKAPKIKAPKMPKIKAPKIRLPKVKLPSLGIMKGLRTVAMVIALIIVIAVAIGAIVMVKKIMDARKGKNPAVNALSMHPAMIPFNSLMQR